MMTTYDWQQAYKAALLETDWTQILKRIQEAEFTIAERQRVLNADHGGTPVERNAIAAAVRGIEKLRTEVGEWQTQQPSSGGVATTSD